jgi:hypothetical protein
MLFLLIHSLALDINCNPAISNFQPFQREYRRKQNFKQKIHPNQTEKGPPNFTPKNLPILLLQLPNPNSPPPTPSARPCFSPKQLLMIFNQSVQNLSQSSRSADHTLVISSHARRPSTSCARFLSGWKILTILNNPFLVPSSKSFSHSTPSTG